MPVELSIEPSAEQRGKREFERLILSGGGAKGAAYIGAYLALEKLGRVNNLKIIAGASAGAIIAAFIAVGISPETLREILSNNNFKDLLGSPKKLINKDGKPLETLIRSLLIATVKDFLISKWNDSSLHTNQDFKNLIRKFVEVEQEEKESSFTFADLEKLNGLFPDRFKQFITLAVDIETGGAQVFNYENTPEVDIALACRASASLPVILKPAEILMDGKVKKFADGGLVDNFPAYFDKNAEGWIIKNQKPKETLVIGFSEGTDPKKNPLFQALHGKPFSERKTKFYHATQVEKFKRNRLPTFFGLKFPFKNTDLKNKGFETISGIYPLNTIGLGVGDIKTTDFATAQKCTPEMVSLGYLDTIAYFINLNFVGSELDDFYVELVQDFRRIYSILKGDWEKNSLGRKITALEDELRTEDKRVISQQVYYLIRDYVESNLESCAAFALSLVVEVQSGILSDNAFCEVSAISMRR